MISADTFIWNTPFVKYQYVQYPVHDTVHHKDLDFLISDWRTAGVPAEGVSRRGGVRAAPGGGS